MPRILFSADNHLRPRTWVKHPELRYDAYVSFRDMLDQAASGSLGAIDAIILGGDLFDSAYPDAMSVSVFADSLNRLVRANVSVYVIDGNHDPATVDAHGTRYSWCAVADWAIPMHRMKVRIGNLVLYGISNVSVDQLAAELALVPPDVNTLVMHQSWKEIQRVGSTEGSLAMLPANVRLLLTGDYHATTLCRGVNAGGLPVLAVSPGSTCMQDLGEAPYKTAFVINTDDAAAPDPIASLVHLPCRPFGLAELRTPEDLDRFVQSPSSTINLQSRELPEVIRKPILRVKYADDLPGAYARITQACGENFHLFVEPVASTVMVEIAPDETIDNSACSNVLSAVEEMTADAPLLLQQAARLWNTADADLDTELNRMLQEAADGPQEGPQAQTAAS